MPQTPQCGDDSVIHQSLPDLSGFRQKLPASDTEASGKALKLCSTESHLLQGVPV